MLSSRREKILKSIIRQYIEKAVPVSSQCIVAQDEPRVSSATIRNEMAFLEKEGYIMRPHPSAGSIPLDKGYRCYVESLSAIELPLAEQRLISHLYHQVERRLEEWLHLTATLMAQLAQNMAVVTMPKLTDCQFKHVELFALRELVAQVILVLRGARIRQQLISFERVISQTELTAMSNKLSAVYSGLTSSQVVAKDIKLFPAEQQVTDCLVEMMQAEDEQEEPYLDGLHFMLNQPEFAHNQRLLSLMELVEHRNLLRTIVPRGLAGRGVQVVIGRENKAEVIHNYSVVISRYGLPEKVAGTIGVVGPTRMPYARTISTVGYLSSLLSSMVAELYGREIAAGPTQYNDN